VRHGQSVSVAALLAAGGAAAADLVYLWVINSEDEGDLTRSRVIFVGSCIVAAAAFAAVGAIAANPWARLVLRAFAAFLLLLFTILGAMSIGILLLVPTLFALRSAGEAAIALPGSRAWPVVVVVAGADVAVVAFGIAGTS
jgi:hypothetical protein